MAVPTVAVNSGRIAPLLNLAAIPITVTYSSSDYTTSSGGLAVELLTILSQSSPYDRTINASDIVGFLPLGSTAEKFIVGGMTVGTTTATSVPVTFRLYGTGSANKAALTEIDDSSGGLSGSFKGLLLIARNGI